MNFHFPLESTEETLEVEFKRELDLTAPVGKAKISKEIGALCNFGGGWIVLGRDDNGKYPNCLPQVLAGITQDTVNQISSKYLIPAPHCTLRWLRPKGVDFDVPVIKVPGVDGVPICGKKNGPQNSGNSFTGMEKGVHYIRTAGPTSEPISSPEQWQDVIRKCVLSDKTQLLSALKTMMSQPLEPNLTEFDQLDTQIDALVEQWIEITTDQKREINPAENFVVLGFEFVGASENLTISIDKIKETLSACDQNRFGPHPYFYLSNVPEKSASVLESNGTVGLRQDAITDSSNNILDLPSLWQLTEKFTGVEIVGFWEDTEWVQGAVDSKTSRKWSRGSYFWPAIHMAYVDTFLWNVWYLAQAVDFAGQVRIKACYCGLAGREIRSASGAYYSMKYISKQDCVNIESNFELGALEDSVRSAAVATIMQSVNKFFQGPEITAESVVKNLNAIR